jgi:hypothetical protein
MPFSIKNQRLLKKQSQTTANGVSSRTPIRDPGRLCWTVKNAKQTQISAFSLKYRGVPKNKAKIEAQRRSASGGQTQNVAQSPSAVFLLCKTKPNCHPEWM